MIDLPLNILTQDVGSKAANEAALTATFETALKNAITLSLFQKENWWGDISKKTSSIGNKPMKKDDSTLDDAELIAVENLQWLVDLGLFEQIIVEPFFEKGALKLQISFSGGSKKGVVFNA